MNEINTWDKVIIKLLINDKGVACKQINTIETLYSLLINSDYYPKIKVLIEEKQWDSIKQFDNYNATGFSEYLDIIKFSDENNTFYLATIYDSMELWQDPIVLDIFPG